MAAALRERRGALGRRTRLVVAPTRYVAGESSAAVHFVNRGDARPTTSPPRMAERGVGGHPTLVQNVETLAHVALIARHGEAWYRSAGRFGTPGTALVTVSGAVAAPGVVEIEYGTTLGEVIGRAGGATAPLRAVALGGYAGSWVRAGDARDLALDPAAMRAAGLTFGCGIVGVLAARACGVAATAEIMSYMAAESAGQCGPCVFGLRSIADATGRLARLESVATDLADVERWTGLVRGRGACSLPDGAADLMTSALEVFGEDLRAHALDARCLAATAITMVA
jgi:NADH:ubiquinone oxidoreductase subunit F (NADH-binding)